MADWQIECLDPSHERGDFCCGKGPLDDFLRLRVTQYQKRNLGQTFVAVDPGEKKVCGYYTLASSQVAFENLPKSLAKKLPRHPVPVVLLGRLAVDRHFQGRGLGSFLLMDALSRCLALSRQLGIHAVEVDAIDPEAKAFYTYFGFVPLLDSDLHLFLPMKTIEEGL